MQDSGKEMYMDEVCPLALECVALFEDAAFPLLCEAVR
jgi:hypothetical protein